MYYKKIETYSYTMPSEHKEYLQFKEELKESGIPFTEEGGAMVQTIQIMITHRFTKEELSGVN